MLIGRAFLRCSRLFPVDYNFTRSALAYTDHQYQRRATHPAVCTGVRGILTHSFDSSPTTCCQKRKVFRGTRIRGAFEIERAPKFSSSRKISSLPFCISLAWASLSLSLPICDEEATLVESCRDSCGNKLWKAPFDCVRATCYGSRARLRGYPRYPVHKLWSLIVLHRHKLQ